MRARVGACGPEIDGLQIARIRSIQRRQTVAEHMADVDVAPVEHDLHAIWASALVGIGNMLDAAADTFGGDGLGRRGSCACGARQSRCCGQTEQSGHRSASCNDGHGFFSSLKDQDWLEHSSLPLQAEPVSSRVHWRRCGIVR